MSEKYRPYCGTEGVGFMERFCYECERDAAFRSGTGPGCFIAVRALAFQVEDDLYPSEWTYDAEGRPTCTAFVAIARVPTDGELEASGQLNLVDALQAMGER